MMSHLAQASRTTGNLFSHFAMAVALAGGAVVGSAVITHEAHAQNTRDFVQVYEPVAELVSGETPSWTAARDQFDAVAAAVESEDDRNVAGNLALQIGNGLNDPAFQRRGLEMMLASGKTAPEQVGMFQFFVGNLAFNAQDFAEARTALEAALAAGYTENDPQGLIVESYLQQGAIAEGVDYLMAQQEAFAANGQKMPEQWYLRVLAEAYDADLAEQSIAVSKALVANHPTSSNWMNALQVVGALRQLEPQVELDLLRLMRETGSLSRRAEYVRYIEAADPRIMANEAGPVLAEGLAADQFDATDNYYLEVKSIADTRGAADRADPDGAYTDGLNGDALDAMASGNVMWSLGDYARAAELYQVAIDKGGDVNAALTRKGMSLAKAGDYAAAVETLGQVTGERKPVAEMWAIYAQTEM